MSHHGAKDGGEGTPLEITSAKATVFVLPIDIVTNVRALILTNQELGKTLPVTVGLPQLMKSILGVISRESINAIFLIGNLVHRDVCASESRKILTMAIRAFEVLPIPVYIMGGEGNRELLWDAKHKSPCSNVRVIYDQLIKFEHPQGRNTFLAHALNADFDRDHIEGFISGLKKALGAEIGADDFLLVGNLHQYAYNQRTMVGSIKDFSPDNHHTGYAVISYGSDCFEVKITGK
jgi:hypothetical protein